MANIVRNERSLWAHSVASDCRTISRSMRIEFAPKRQRGRLAPVGLIYGGVSGPPPFYSAVIYDAGGQGVPLFSSNIRRHEEQKASSPISAFRSSLLGVLLGILVHSASRLAAQTTSLHILHQQWRGAELLAQRPMKIFKNVETSVEPYKIDQFERSHGMVEAKLESFVNVCCRSDPLLEHIKRLVADHRIDTAGDE